MKTFEEFLEERIDWRAAGQKGIDQAMTYDGPEDESHPKKNRKMRLALKMLKKADKKDPIVAKWGSKPRAVKALQDAT